MAPRALSPRDAMGSTATARLRAEEEELEDAAAIAGVILGSHAGAKRYQSWRALGVVYIVLAIAWVGTDVVFMYFVRGIGDPPKHWSFALPDLGATIGKAICMGTHFVAGSVLTLLGVWQVWPRSRSPSLLHLHRWGGRLFVACGVLAALGGLGFILQQRVLVGGLAMSMSFAIYGLLVLTFSVLAWWTARAKDFEAHRRWAFRAFAMGISSFVYRVLVVVSMEIGLMPIPTKEMAQPRTDRSTYYFSVPVGSQLNTWSFWILPLLVVEWYLRAPATRLHRRLLDGLLVGCGALLGTFLLSLLRLGRA